MEILRWISGADLEIVGFTMLNECFELTRISNERLCYFETTNPEFPDSGNLNAELKTLKNCARPRPPLEQNFLCFERAWDFQLPSWKGYDLHDSTSVSRKEAAFNSALTLESQNDSGWYSSCAATKSEDIVSQRIAPSVSLSSSH